MLFQSTHPCWVRLIYWFCVVSVIRISIHAPVLGATTTQSPTSRFDSLFQSTHPCWVRLWREVHEHRLQNFNPRTRAGCDIGFLDKRDQMLRISIHAPVLGATLAHVRKSSLSSCISIHAPVLGATKKRGLIMAILNNFNPRTRAGCDVKNSSRRLLERVISIHAPVLGATWTAAGIPLPVLLFQSTHPCWVRLQRHGE